MNQDPRPDAASEWLAVLLDNPDDLALRSAFRAWIDADPAHARDWAEIARTYDLLGLTLPRHMDHWAAYAAERGAPRPAPSIPKTDQARSGRGRGRVRGVFAFALAACLALFVVTNAFDQVDSDAETGTGEVKRIDLADGSVVQLGPESALQISFSETERRVRLIDGIAYFDVDPDPARPFVIAAGSVRTTVLGTAFEVNMTDDGVAVAVREGRVRVGIENGFGEVQHLEAGERIRVADDGTLGRSRLRPQHVGAWMDGRLVANDMTVGDIVDTLRRYIDRSVLIYGDRFSVQPLTGVYNLAHAETALQAVAGANGAELYRPTPWSFLLLGE